MKIKENYKVRKVAGENLIIGQGASHSDMTKIISLNSTALFLWEQFDGREFTVDDAAEALVGEFGIGMEQARADVKAWTDKMIAEGIIE